MDAINSGVGTQRKIEHRPRVSLPKIARRRGVRGPQATTWMSSRTQQRSSKFIHPGCAT